MFNIFFFKKKELPIKKKYGLCLLPFNFKTKKQKKILYFFNVLDSSFHTYNNLFEGHFIKKILWVFFKLLKIKNKHRFVFKTVKSAVNLLFFQNSIEVKHWLKLIYLKITWESHKLVIKQFLLIIKYILNAFCLYNYAIKLHFTIKGKLGILGNNKKKKIKNLLYTFIKTGKRPIKSIDGIPVRSFAGAAFFRLTFQDTVYLANYNKIKFK